MTLDGIFSLLEGISSKMDNKEGRIESIKETFDTALGINKEEHDKVSSLLDQYEDSEEEMEFFNKKMEEAAETIDKLRTSMNGLNKDIPKDKKTIEETEAKISQEQKNIENYKKRVNDANTNKLNAERQLGKFKVGNIKDAVSKNKTMKDGLRDALNTKGYANFFKSIKGNIYFEAAKLLVNVIEFGIGKATEYAKVAGENLLRTINTSTVISLNKMQVGLDAWQDALNGSYSAQMKANESQIELLKTQNANTMASYKLEHTWTNWIPIWGQINKYNETTLEIEQKLAESRLENANKIISKSNEYTKRADDYLKKQDDAIHKYQALNGLTVEQTQVFEKRMLANGEAFSKFGKTIEDALKIQNAVTEQSGRAVKFSNEDFTKSFAVGRLVGEDTLTQFQSMMNIFNTSVSSSTDIMYDMYKYANKMGLSQQKLTKSVLSNMKLANKYDFKNGTRGFIELAKWAENARMNLSSFGSAIEKVQSGGLEGIIKQGAGLQVLGGNFAMGADPLAMFYEASSDQEAYAKRIQGMLKGYGSFNRQTGETTFSGLENYMLRAASEQLGMPVEDIKDMIRGARQKEYVKAQMGSSKLSKENQEAVANIAQYDQKSKKWYVNTINGGTKNVSDMTNEDMAKILSNNKEENAEKYAQQTYSAVEKIQNTTLEINSKMGVLSSENFFENVNRNIATTISAFKKNMDEVVNTINQNREDAYNDLVREMNDLGDIFKNYKKARETMDLYENEKLEDANYVARRMEDAEQGKTHAAYDAASKEYEDAYKANMESSGLFEKIKSSFKFWSSVNKLSNAASIDAKKNGDYIPFITGITNTFREVFTPKTVINENHLRDKYNIEDGILSESKPSVVSSNSDVTLFNDGMVSANGTPLYSQAANITPIHDGSMRMAKSDPKDVGLFAKIGGPFDTLFNGVLGRINDLYDYFTNPQEQAKKLWNVALKGGDVYNNSSVRSIWKNTARNSNVTYNEESGKVHGSVLLMREAARQMGVDSLPMDTPFYERNYDRVNNNSNIIKFDTLRIELNGNLDLSSGGQSVNIINELQSNPLLLRSLSRMITKQISSSLNAGRGISEFDRLS